MEIQILLLDGKQVEARWKGTSIVVGQEEGESTREPGVEPLDLFFASLGLCAGKYVMEFCRSRGIPYEDTLIHLRTDWDDKKKMHTRVTVQIQLSQGFPEKYKEAVLRAVDLCSVKKHILDPPAFEIEARVAALGK